MSVCCVPGCKSAKRRESGRTLSFHRFPVESKLRTQWIVKIRRDIGPNFKITSNTKVCCNHFSPECYDGTCLLPGRKKYLLPGSVPQLFPWTKATKARSRRLRLYKDPAGGEIQDKQNVNPTPPAVSMDQIKDEKPAGGEAQDERQEDDNEKLIPTAIKADVQSEPHPDHDYSQLPLPLEEQLDAAQQEIERLTQENKLLKALVFKDSRTMLSF